MGRIPVEQIQNDNLGITMNNNTKPVEPIFTRESGLNFTKVVISPIVKNRIHRADFSYWIGDNDTFKISTSIKGKGIRNTIEKTEKFLTTELQEPEYEITTNYLPIN